MHRGIFSSLCGLYPLLASPVLKCSCDLFPSEVGRGRHRDSAFKRRVSHLLFSRGGGRSYHIGPATGGSTRVIQRLKDRGESTCRGGMGESG